MARLFTALWPPPAAVAALDGELAAAPDWPPEGWRLTPSARWHLTLCFHGEADPDEAAARLAARAGGRPAPWLRLAGAVTFSRVAAVGVLPAGPADALALRALVTAAGGEASGFRAHLTVARSHRGSRLGAVAAPLRAHAGPWWHPAQVCLVRSQLGPGGPRYTVLDRVPLVPPPGPAPDPAAPPGPGPAPGRAPRRPRPGRRRRPGHDW